MRGGGQNAGRKRKIKEVGGKFEKNANLFFSSLLGPRERGMAGVGAALLYPYILHACIKLFAQLFSAPPYGFYGHILIDLQIRDFLF